MKIAFFVITVITLSLNSCIQSNALRTVVTEPTRDQIKATTTPSKSPTHPEITQLILTPSITNLKTSLTPTIQETPVPEIKIAGRNPLTGTIVADPSILDRRPIAVKVQLFPRGARPPWGISLADIVYDYYQNNGVTRLTAIFYGNNAEQVGPIRSARLFDADIVNMYQAIFVFGLADQRIYQRLRKANFSDRLVVEKYGICPPLCRIDPEGYNHLLVNTELLSEYANKNGISNKRQPLEDMYFDQFPPENGNHAEQIFVRISHSAYSRWEYHPTNEKYWRFQDEVEALPGEESFSPLKDRLTGKQIGADNVVILLMPHKYAYSTDAGEGELFDIKYKGNGDAYAFRNGLIYKLHWNAGEDYKILQLSYPDGTPYNFKPGNTWFHIIGKTSVVEKQENWIWRFEFKVP